MPKITVRGQKKRILKLSPLPYFKRKLSKSVPQQERALSACSRFRRTVTRTSRKGSYFPSQALAGLWSRPAWCSAVTRAMMAA